jgi:hypothetical protein
MNSLPFAPSTAKKVAAAEIFRLKEQKQATSTVERDSLKEA